MKKGPHIVLVPFKPHLQSLYVGLVERGCRLTGLAAPQWIATHQFGSVVPVPIKIMVGYPILLYRYINIPWQAPRYIWRFGRTVTGLQPDVLVLFDAYHWYLLQAMRVKRRSPRLKLVVYSETKRWPRRWVSAVIMRFFLRMLRRRQALVDVLFVYTSEGAKFMSEYIDPKKIHLLPAPINTAVFNTDARPVPQTRGPLRILMNARFEPYKNHADLLAALAQLRAQGYQFQLTLIGRSDSGMTRVHDMVHQHALSDWVTWEDPVPLNAMPRLYHRHDVLVLPSYNEAIGMVVPEAMACGMATITSDTVGANVYVQPDKTGQIFPTGDVPGLQAALRRYLDDSTLVQHHGAAAAQHIAEHFSVAQVSQQMLTHVDDGRQKTHS